LLICNSPAANRGGWSVERRHVIRACRGADLIELARRYGRSGYRKIAALLRDAGWLVNDKRVERIWRREGLKVPRKQPKRGRLWLNDGSCIRLRPEHRNHVWSYDFVEDRTHDGRKDRMLNVVDEFTHECLAIRINRKLKATDVIDVLSDLFVLRGVPGTSAPITGLSSWPRPCRTGSRRSALRLPPSRPAVPGKMSSSRASMRAFACLDHVVVFGERHLRHLLGSYQRYYNDARTHLSLNKDAPASCTVQAIGRIVAAAHFGGLHHQYIRI
jgi:putative transposase